MKSKGVSLWPPHLALPKRAKSLAAAPWRAAASDFAKLIAATGKPKKSNKRPGETGGLQLLRLAGNPLKPTETKFIELLAFSPHYCGHAPLVANP